VHDDRQVAVKQLLRRRVRRRLLPALRIAQEELDDL
jgi:hypothetical protein